MGWDAYSTKDGKDIEVNWKHWNCGKNEIKDIKLRKVFTNASDKVKKKTGSADWLLELGGLDCSACGHSLKEATGMSCWGDALTPKQVKEYYDNACWENVSDKYDKCLVESAKAFLEVCAKEGLGIRFSY